MKIRAIKKRVTRLLEPQIVRGRIMRSPIQMQRAFGFVYPLRKNRQTQVIAHLGKTKVTRVTPGLIENDLSEPMPIEPISKNRLVFSEIDWSEIKVGTLLSAGVFSSVYTAQPERMNVALLPNPDESDTLQKWLADGSAEIVPGPHGTYSIIDATGKP